jgi:DNA polymerase-1
MLGGFKDLSELHIASVEAGQPEMFDKVLDAALWSAKEAKQRSSTFIPLVKMNVDERSLKALGAVRLVDVKDPGPDKLLIRDMVMDGEATYVYGPMGVCKSLVTTAMAVAIASPEVSEIFGKPVEEHGPTILFDSEMTEPRFKKRVDQICEGLGIEFPRNLYYKNVVGVSPKTSFSELHKLAELVNAIAVVIDSIGFAVRGDPESYNDVRNNTTEYVDPLIKQGVAPIIVEHKPHQGDHMIGSVAKGYHGRFIFRVDDLDGDDRILGERHVRLVNKKASFMDEGQKVPLTVYFKDNRIRFECDDRSDFGESPVREATSEIKVRSSLIENGPQTKGQLSSSTGLSVGTLGNVLPDLVRKKQIHIENTQGKAYVYSLVDARDDEREASKQRSSTFTTPRGMNVDERSSEITPEKKKKAKLSPEEEVENRARLAEKYNYVHTEEAAERCLEWVKAAPYVALDIETYGRLKRDGLLYTRANVRLIQLHLGEETWFIDCDHIPDGHVAPILEELQDKPKYLHNALFDIPRLYRRFGILLDQDVRDTMLASRVARAGEWERRNRKVLQKSHALEDCLKRELSIEVPKDRKLKWGGPLQEEHLKYAADDVAHLRELYAELQEVLQQNGVKERYEAISARLPNFIGAAVRGVPLDTGTLQPALDALEHEKENLESRLDELAPEHPEGLQWVWGNTSKEITREGRGRNGALRALGLLGVELSDLQDQTLLDHREDHELVHVLYLYRKAANTLSRYSKWIPDFYDEETGRMYPQPKVAAAVTGRVLYSDPNAQGIDKKKTDEFRKCIRAPEGRAIVKGDFAQQELRIAAYYSRDKNMLEAFANGDDIYLTTAAKLVGKPVDKDHPARQAAKRATLGFLYGLGTEKYRTNVYKDTGERLSTAQANKDRKAFREAFPEFYKWQQSYGAMHEWETRSVLGWRRVVAPDHEGNPKYTDRLNGPIQSTAGDILYLTLEKMAADPHPDTQFLLSVHDELVLECPEEVARDVARWVKAKMRAAMEEVLGTELGGEKSVEVEYGPSWGECTEEV